MTVPRPTLVVENDPWLWVEYAYHLEREMVRLRDICERAVDALRYEAHPVCDEWDALAQSAREAVSMLVAERDARIACDDAAVERAAGALYDLREHAGIRAPVSMWPPSDPDEADDYRLEARTVLRAAGETP